jgi:hypothetical protein
MASERVRRAILTLLKLKDVQNLSAKLNHSPSLCMLLGAGFCLARALRNSSAKVALPFLFNILVVIGVAPA